LTNLSRDVKQILSAVRGPAHYKGQLAIVNYYSLNYASAAVNGQSRELNQAVDSAARPFGVVFADSYGIFKQASVRFGASPCLAGLLTQLDGLVGNCGVHPTFAGQALLAQALLKAIRVSGPQPSLRLPAPPHRGGLG
ncbi:MAG: hypothetical protein ACJ8DJ_09675, partial [Gemmatimonadales bacterium]